jgi:hypothetical protein
MVKKTKEVKTVQPSFRVTEDLWFAMKGLAVKQRRKVGELAREAFEEYLRKHSGDSKDAVKP